MDENENIRRFSVGWPGTRKTTIICLVRCFPVEPAITHTLLIRNKYIKIGI